MDCIFCKIVSGQIPAKKIHETGNSLVFLDAFPLTPGHVLVIPKSHYVTVQQMSNNDNADLFECVRLISNRIERIAPSSLIAIHNGKESGQEIPHVHVHIIPRKTDDNVGPIHSMFTNRPKLSENEFVKIVEILKKE